MRRPYFASLWIWLLFSFFFLQFGYSQKRKVPHGYYLGPVLVCDNGYKDVRGECAKLPDVANGHYFGFMLICNNGYEDIDGKCVKLPKVTNGHYFGSVLICNDGYEDNNGKCVKVPDVANGIRSGSVLICKNGYEDIGGKCVKLPDAKAGRYLGSVLICNDGYRDIGGKCVRLPTIANSIYVGSVLVCSHGHIFENGKCLPSANPSTPWQRVDTSRFKPSAGVPDPLLSWVDLLSHYQSVGWPRLGSAYGTLPSLTPIQRTSLGLSSGSSDDWQSGNLYRWTHLADGSTDLIGFSINKGSNWRTTIKPDGSMSGFDKDLNIWKYDAGSSFYINFGTSKICYGKGIGRFCF